MSDQDEILNAALRRSVMIKHRDDYHRGKADGRREALEEAAQKLHRIADAMNNRILTQEQVRDIANALEESEPGEG